MGMPDNPSADKFSPPPGQERFEPPKPRRGPQWFAFALVLVFYLVRYQLEHMHTAGWLIPVALLGLFVADFLITPGRRNHGDAADADTPPRNDPR
jgi:hypothetical protein